MEKAHDISIDEPCVAHQAILFMLDVLMRNNKPTLALAELYDSFGDKSFTPQMLRAVGGNEQGLRQFLIRYPSLFTVNGDSISANSGGNQLPRNSTTPERYLRNKPKQTKQSNNNNDQQSNTPFNSNNTTNSDGVSSTSSSSGDLINSSSSSTSSTSSPLSNTNTTTTATSLNNGEQSATISSSSSPPQYDSKTMKEIEQEAIAFFRKQISKREEDWLPIVSVAGHASQSSSDVRKYVGPQNEFKSFLLKYPHIFVVREEYCGLKGKADLSTAPFPPPSPPPKRRLQNSISIIGQQMLNPNSAATPTNNNNLISRNHSLRNTNRYSACGNLMPNATNNGCLNPSSLLNNNQTIVTSNNNNSLINNNSNSISSNLNGTVINPSTGMTKPRLTPVEVKAVHYVMRILHKNGRMLLQTIPGLISRAPDQVSNIVGFTREDLIQFFKRHSAIFQLHPDGCVSVKQDAVKALILKDGTNGSGSSGLANGGSNGASGVGGSTNGGQDGAVITNNGVVLRIFPKYGILNMENNEQVFFDIQSCQFETFSDLTTILHTGDKLYFNAIIGPRDGSTKWRSLKTWIKMKPQQQSNLCLLENMSSHSDADKSDDSSTSSLGGVGGNGNGTGTGGNVNYGNSSSFSRTSRSINSSNNNNNNSNNNNGYMNQLYQNGNNSHYYMLNNNSGTNSNLGFNSTSSPLNTSNMILNQSISSLSIDENSVLISNGISESVVGNNNNNTNTTTSNNIISLNGTLVNSTSGDFNQYQLESGEYNSQSINSTPSTPICPVDSDLSDLASVASLSNHSSNLIHSSSASNLHLFQQQTINNSNILTNKSNNNNNNNNALISSNSIHSFNLLTSSVDSQNIEHIHKKNIEDKSAVNNTNNTITTKFMKQSADNISQREIITNLSTTSEMISIGCQTISTGDITVTNVYIE